MKWPLDALDTERQAESHQRNSRQATPQAHPGTPKERPQRKPERGKHRRIEKHQHQVFLIAGSDSPELGPQVDAGVFHPSAADTDQRQRIQQVQPHENRHTQSDGPINRKPLLPD